MMPFALHLRPTAASLYVPSEALSLARIIPNRGYLQSTAYGVSHSTNTSPPKPLDSTVIQWPNHQAITSLDRRYTICRHSGASRIQSFPYELNKRFFARPPPRHNTYFFLSASQVLTFDTI